MKQVYAQLENPVLENSIRNETGTSFFDRAIPFFITWLVLIGSLFFIAQFLLGGYKWINGQGQKDKLEQAQKQITNALIGLLVVFSIYAITKVMGTVFGLTGFENLQISLPEL